VTIAISMKVNDGIVLAADSASTMIGYDHTGKGAVVNIYDNADKIFNLRKGFPIGAVTWGAGSIGQASISTLAKDFRKLITKDDNYKIDKDDYKVEDVANKFKEFIFGENYEIVFESLNDNQKPSLGFIVVGYSAGEPLAEEYLIQINKGKCIGPKLLRKKSDVGVSSQGVTEAISRVYGGVSLQLINVLREAGLDDKTLKNIIKLCRQRLPVPMVTPAMPIQDAIDLANFLVETTTQFTRFAPGPATVGGPTEIATITKHEGFKWIKRKHYFNTILNPEGSRNE